MLDAAGHALVIAHRPGLRTPTVVTAGWSYLRFHQGQTARPEYRRDTLRRWAERIAGLEAREAWVYFNNDTGGAAVRDARSLREALVELGASVA